MSSAILLVNLGSPESPSVSDVRRYLAQFLMDKYVIDAPYLLRALIIYGFILPFRPKKTAEAYLKIWTKEGSPLVVCNQLLCEAIREKCSQPVALGMRYGKPSIKAGIAELLAQGPLKTLYLVPLYPHYAMSSTETVLVETQKQLSRLSPTTTLKWLPPFYKDPSYIACLVETIQAYCNTPYDHLLFSYHGLPDRHLRKTDPTKTHCLSTPLCCETPSKAHAKCYKHQVFETTKLVVNQLKPTQNWSISFQSRLGRDPWILPNTESEIIRLAEQGKKHLLVACPSFVSDCLETLEEIEERAKALFLEHGGETLRLIPCLNLQPSWIEALSQWCEEPSYFVSLDTPN